MDFRQLRKERHLTLKQVAEMTGWAISTISDFERTGEGGPHMREKLEEVYGIRNSPGVAILADRPDQNLIDDALAEVQTIRDALNDLERKLKKLKS